MLIDQNPPKYNYEWQRLFTAACYSGMYEEDEGLPPYRKAEKKVNPDRIYGEYIVKD